MADFAVKKSSAKKAVSVKNNGNGGYAESKTVYDDVFGGPPKFGVPSLNSSGSSQIDDYSEIFGSFNSSRVSSIPILDLPIVDEKDVSIDVRSSKFDYSEVFGGFNGLDFAVSYEELLAEDPKGGGESSSDDAWTSADTGSPSEGSSEDPACSETNQTFSNEQSYESEGTKQFNVLYQKSNQISRDDERTATTHIAQLNSVPAFTFLVDENLSSQKAEKDNTLDQVTKFHSLDLDLGDHVTEGKDLKETAPDQSVYHNIAQISEFDAILQASHLKETISYKPFSPAVREPSESDLVHQRNQLKEIILHQPVSHAVRQISEGDSIHPKNHLKDTSLGQSVAVSHIPERALEPQGKPGGNVSQPSKGFVTVSEINLRTNPCHVPPPSRPPPKISIWRGDSKIYTASHPRASENYVVQRAVSDGSPQFFDVEVDASSSAEASATAMKEAMDIAQARLKSAKELMERKKDGLQNRKKMGLKGESKFIEKREWETTPQAQCSNEKPTDTSEHTDKEIKGFNLEERAKAPRVVEVDEDWRVTGEKLVNAPEEMAEQNFGEETGSTQASHGDEEEIGEWKVDEQYYELVQTIIPRAVMETSKHESMEDLKSTLREPEVAHVENTKAAHVENTKAAHGLHMRVEYEKEFNVAQEVRNGERNDDHYNLELKKEDDEKKLNESSDESVPKFAQTHVQEDNEQIQKKERKREEIEEREKMTREREEREKRLEEAREQEENERRKIEAHEREQNEKRLKESREREEDAKRLKEAQELDEKRREEAREHEKKENERRLKEELEREETEKKLKEAREREVIEKNLKETLEREENERRLREVCEREEFEKRQAEARDREEEKQRLKEDREQEENERQQELKREENEKNVKAAQEAREQEENEMRQHELKREKNVKAAQEDREQEEIERSQQELKREENEKNVKAAQEALVHREGEGNLKTLSGSLENADSGNRKKAAEEACRQDEDKNLNATREHCKQERDTNIANLVQMSSEPDLDKTKEVACGTKLQDSEKNFAEEAVVFQEKVERSKKMSQGAPEQEENNCAAQRKKLLVENGRKLEATHPTNIIDAKNLSVSQNLEKKDKTESLSMEEREKEKMMQREREREIERLRKVEEDREREREREKDRMAVERATREARERALADARERAERAAVERATAEARQRAVADARERLDRASAVTREKSVAEKSFAEGKIRAERDARLRLERAAVERATAEARERAAEKLKADKGAFGARERTERTFSEKYPSTFRDSGIRHTSSFSDLRDTQHQSSGASNSFQRYLNSSNQASNVNERYQGADIVESAQRCKARLERHQRTVERAAKALAEKNMRDLLAQREQAERNRFSETLDAEVRRWSNGKEGNLRALLSTLQYILGPYSGWHPVPLTEVITAVAVKKAYRKATLCVHPDKLQQRGATIQQKYICEKVFDLLKDAWNKFNSEER